ncbi:unnamed protein product [Aureobasidium mustum]|uniref:Mtf2-like C-terminal domain-containing protein n=1 Tax=Aureobasidium mustum TaxID=2773714 RepID=A0A9N8PIT8_9PEZI|nr:unnamed protein product [Aureobasidium mustum]
MSGCANAGQALGRGLKLYTSRSTYTLPFLYQTPTLRRYYSALQDLAKENASKTNPKTTIRKPAREPTSTTAHTTTKSDYQDFVPFETLETAEPPVAQDTVQGESLTGTERHAFAQLEALANAPKRPATKTRKFPQRDAFINLDDVLNEAITNIEASEQQQRDFEHRSRALTKERSTILSKRRDRGGAAAAKTAAKQKKLGKTEQDAQSLTTAPQIETESVDTKEQEETEYQKFNREDRRTLATLHAVPTDTKIWSILEERLFSQIALLHLDSPVPASTTISPKRRQFLMQTFPLRLVTAASILRRYFPTSNLILAILPRVKQLGPSAYALATTSDLYNQLLAFYFRKFGAVDTCNELLQEMENNIIEPSASTLKVLDYILQYREDCIENSKLGPSVKSLFTTEKFRRDFATMEKWRAKVEQSLAEQESRAQRKLQEREQRSEEMDELSDLSGPLRRVEV